MLHAGPSYPKRMWRSRGFTPLKGWNRGFCGVTFIRISGRRIPQLRSHRTWEKKLARQRRRDKRTNWLALRDEDRRATKRYADRTAGRVPSFPRHEVVWDTAFIARLLNERGGACRADPDHAGDGETLNLRGDAPRRKSYNGMYGKSAAAKRPG